MRRHLPTVLALLVLVATIVLPFVVVLLVGCGPSAPAAVAHAVKEIPKQPPAPATVSGIRTEIDSERRLVAEHQARIDYLEQAQIAEEQEAERQTLLWAALLCLAGVGVCTAGFFWLPLPVLKRVALYAGASLVVVALLALGFREVLPWLRMIMVGFFLVAGLVAILAGGPWLKRLLVIAHHHLDDLPDGAVRDALARLASVTRPPPPPEERLPSTPPPAAPPAAAA